MLKYLPWIIAATVATMAAMTMLGCSQSEPDAIPQELPLPTVGSSQPANVANTLEPTAEATTGPRTSGSSAIAIAEATAVAPPPPATVVPSVAADTPVPTDSPAEPTRPLETPGPQSLASLYPDGETLIQLIDPLDEPEYYCVDVRGFGSNSQTDRSLQAHTCKPGGEDELFLVNHPSEGQLFMPAYDLCLEAEGNEVYTRTCSDAASQIFSVGSDGTVRTGDGQLCLSVAPGEGEQAGGVSHVRRDLMMLDCTEGQRHLARWILPGSSPSAAQAASTRLMYEALDAALRGDPWGLARLGNSGDPTYVPVLVELMRFPWWQIDRDVEVALYEALDTIADRNPAIADVEPGSDVDEWVRWVVWIGKHPEVWPPPGFAGWKGRLFGDLVDPAMGAFLYDGIRANIRVEEIVWGGVRKDGIPDLTNAPVIDGANADYLDPQDRVFGVSFNGEHRAYPHRIVNAHEMANDVVGGVPFALAY